MSPQCPKCSGLMMPGLPSEMACIQCGKRIYDPWPEDKPQTAKEKELNGKWQYTTCEVCGGRMRLSTGRTFCCACMNQLRNWQRSNKTGPAPIIEVDGKWKRNPKWKGKLDPRGPSHNRAAA